MNLKILNKYFNNYIKNLLKFYYYNILIYLKKLRLKLIY